MKVLVLREIFEVAKVIQYCLYPTDRSKKVAVNGNILNQWFTMGEIIFI